MVLPRRPLSGWRPLFGQRTVITARNSTARQTWHRLRARGYATGGGHGEQKSSDLTWAATSIAVTVPALWWIGLHKPEEGGHGHGHNDRNEPTKDGSSEEEEPKDEGGESFEEPGNDSSSEGEGENQETPDTSDDESAEDKGDGSDSEGKDEGEGEVETNDGAKNKTVKYEDAKGGIKNRKESKQAKNQGGPSSDEDAKGKPAKEPAGSKNSSSTSGKQEGISNTDTKHSTDAGNDPSKSKKPEGGPDTAKAKGSVDPERVQK